MTKAKVITFKASDEFVALLDKVAMSKGVSRSELIRAAVLYVISKGLVDEALRETRYGYIQELELGDDSAPAPDPIVITI